MPTRPEGVYAEGRGGWYLKVTLGRDPWTGRREQITKRGFRTATEAEKARRDLLGTVDQGLFKPAPGGTTVNELMDLYLDGLDADGRRRPRPASTTATPPTTPSGGAWGQSGCATSRPR